MAARQILAVLGVAAVAVMALLAFAWRPAIAPIAPPAPSSFPTDLIATGEALASAGMCIDCHTARGGAASAGGKPIGTRIGTFYSTNLTPDPETGIGAWSEAAFARALREGVSRDGRHLFPVFPYTHYTQLTDADVRAIYAYFMSRPPVKAPNKPNTVIFPLDARPVLALWKSLFFKPGPYRPDPAHDQRWNRGAYLAEALAACSTCHTARNLLGAESVGHPYAGAVQDGWHAASLDISHMPFQWTGEALFAYLRHGDSPPHGVPLGPMRAVVRDLAKLSDDDLRAMTAYFISLNHPFVGKREAALARARSPVAPVTERQKEGQALFVQHCASCHGMGDGPPPVARSPLGMSATLWDRYRVHNLAATILDGIDGSDGLPGAMPGFRDKLTDHDIESLALYLRAAYTTWPAFGLMKEWLPLARNEPMKLP